MNDLIDVLNDEGKLNSTAIHDVLEANGQYIKIAKRHYWKVSNKLYPLRRNWQLDDERVINNVKGSHLQLHERLEMKNFHPKIQQLDLLHRHLSDYVINFKLKNEDISDEANEIENEENNDDLTTKNKSLGNSDDKNTALEKQNFLNSLQKQEIMLYRKLNEVLSESLLDKVKDFSKPIHFSFPLNTNAFKNKQVNNPIQLEIVLTPKSREAYHKSSSERTKLYQHLKAWDNHTKNLWYLKQNSTSNKQHLQTKSECEFLNTAFFPAFKCKTKDTHACNNQHNIKQDFLGNNLQLKNLRNNFGNNIFNDYPYSNAPAFVGGDAITKSRMYDFLLGNQTYNRDVNHGFNTAGAELTSRRYKELQKRKHFLPNIHNKHQNLNPYYRNAWTSPVDEYYRLKLCKLAEMISNRRREKKIKL